MIYFIQAEGVGHIKIGFTGGDPMKRMADLQTGCPHKLALVAAIDGGEQDEARWHKDFADSRLKGEWFEITPRLLIAIARAACLAGIKQVIDRVNSLELLIYSRDQRTLSVAAHEDKATVEKVAPTETDLIAPRTFTWWSRFLEWLEARRPILTTHLRKCSEQFIEGRRDTSFPDVVLVFPEANKEAALAVDDQNVKAIEIAFTEFHKTTVRANIYIQVRVESGKLVSAVSLLTSRRSYQ